jgi:hypothetical protein
MKRLFMKRLSFALALVLAALPPIVLRAQQQVDRKSELPTLPSRALLNELKGEKGLKSNAGTDQTVDNPHSPVIPVKINQDIPGLLPPGQSITAWAEEQNKNLLDIIKLKLNDSAKMAKYIADEDALKLTPLLKVQFRIAYIKAKMEEDSKH